jgi:hypothetical protein
MSNPPDYLTIAEAAQRYGKPKRKFWVVLQNLKKAGFELPILNWGDPDTRPDTRNIMFNWAKRQQFEEALHAWDSASQGADPPAPSRSTGTLRAGAYAAALKATTASSRKNKRRSSKPNSCAPSGTVSVVALAPSRKRR